jgi:predicted ribosome-associated RNA-binding protein Tma20
LQALDSAARLRVLENRKAWINEINGANIVAAGICAHESAMKNGEIIEVPEFLFQ